MKIVKSLLSVFVGLLVFLSTTLFTGCERGTAQTQLTLPHAPSRTYSSEDIQQTFFKNGINTGNFIITDNVYVLTTRDWIQSEFSPGLAAFQFQMGINNWKPESNDCDKFTLGTTFYAKWLNHSSPNRKVNASLACGEVFYTNKDTLKGHAINFFIVNQESELKLLFYEPQTRRFVSLTQTELFSIFFWKI